MDQQYGNSVHMSTFPIQSHHQHTGQPQYQSQGQYQHMFPDYSDACYQSPAFADAAFSVDQYGYHSTSSVPYGTGIESYLDPKYASNPTAFASRLPYLPFHAAAVAAYGVYDYSFEPAFIRKRNERERQRVKCVNEGYARLREHLPEEFAEKRLSKVETLRGAILYIKQLQSLLGFDPENSPRIKNSGEKNEPDRSDEKADHESAQGDSDKKSPNDNARDQNDSIENETFNDLVEKIELNADDLLNSADDISCSGSKLGLSARTSKIPHTSAESVMESPSLSSHEYSPKHACPSPPSKSRMCGINGSISRKSCAVAEQSSCIEGSSPPINASRASSRKTDREQCDWWSRVCGRSNTNTIFDLVEDCEPVSKQFGVNHTENVGWVGHRNPRHHPYKKSNAKCNSLRENWDDVFHIKAETQTPPPYDERYEYFCQQQYSSCQRDFTKMSQNEFKSNRRSKGGQSDGFKTDTSPESIAGLSP